MSANNFPLEDRISSAVYVEPNCFKGILREKKNIIFVRGAPGVGKTTLINKITQEKYANNNYVRIDISFYPSSVNKDTFEREFLKKILHLSDNLPFKTVEQVII